MGRWLDRLKTPSPCFERAVNDTHRAGEDLNPIEPSKPNSIGFIGSVSGDTPKTISVRHEIVRACDLSGFSVRELEDGLSDNDLADIQDGILTAEVLAEYGELFKESGYFWRRDTSLQEPRDEGPEQQPAVPVTVEKPSTCNAWPERKQQARDQFINHVLICDYCYGPRDRYCEIGSSWREFFYSM